jgi:hypothetical protein
MKEIIIKTSIWKSLAFLSICLIFGVLGIILLIQHETPKAVAYGILFTIIFVFGGIVFSIQMLNRKPRITINDSGIEDRKLGVGKILWEDIESVELRRVFATSFIVLKLANKEKYLEKLDAKGTVVSKLNKKLGSGELNLNLNLVDMKPKAIHEIILKHI